MIFTQKILENLYFQIHQLREKVKDQIILQLIL